MKEPEALAARPHRGKLPIPFVTYVDPDGKPDFRVHDNARRQECATKRLCQLCGTKMASHVTFVGTKGSVERRTFGEPPGHRECLLFALEVCPWLAGSDYRSEWLEGSGFTRLTTPEIDDEPIALYTCGGFKIIADDEGSGSIKWVAKKAPATISWLSRSPDRPVD